MNSNMETYYVYTDGASRGNPGPSAAGFVLKDSAGILREKRGNYLGRQTNNSAEYQAVILALEKIKELIINPKRAALVFNLDSQLVVKQLSGEFKVRNPFLANFVGKIKSLEASYGSVEYTHIPRETNTEADRLVNEILDNRW